MMLLYLILPYLAYGQCAFELGNTGVADVLQCMDYSYCNGAVDGWDCCKCRGGRRMCPSNLPNMCATPNKCGGGTAVCCNNARCKNDGGFRTCPASGSLPFVNHPSCPSPTPVPIATPRPIVTPAPVAPTPAPGPSYTVTQGSCKLADGSSPPPSGYQMHFTMSTASACEAACTNDPACTGYQFAAVTSGPGCFTYTAAVTHGAGVNPQFPYTCHVISRATPSPIPMPCKDVNLFAQLNLQLAESLCNQNPACEYNTKKQKCKKRRNRCKFLSESQCAQRSDCHRIYKKANYKRCCSLDFGSDYQLRDGNLCDPTTMFQCKFQGETDCAADPKCNVVMKGGVFKRCCNPSISPNC